MSCTCTYTKFPIYKVWWLREASQIRQTFIPIGEKVIWNTAQQNSTWSSKFDCNWPSFHSQKKKTKKKKHTKRARVRRHTGRPEIEYFFLAFKKAKLPVYNLWWSWVKQHVQCLSKNIHLYIYTFTFDCFWLWVLTEGALLMAPTHIRANLYPCQLISSSNRTLANSNSPLCLVIHSFIISQGRNNHKHNGKKINREKYEIHVHEKKVNVTKVLTASL